MHIILGFLTIIFSILYFLDRMGIDFGGLNPWSWRRRRNWRNQFKGDPIYSVEDPMAVASILVVGAAKLDGDLTAEQKSSLLEQFETKFSITNREATELLASSSHLLGGPQVMDKQLKGLIQRNSNTFSAEQVESVADMIGTVVAVGGSFSESQSEFLVEIQSGLAQDEANKSEWT